MGREKKEEEEEERSLVKHTDITITNSHMQDISLFNSYMPRYFVNTKYPEAKGLPVLADGGLLQTNGKKYSTTSSLNKGSPFSKVHVSRMPQNNTHLKQTIKIRYAS